jgi:hypothetical protein
VIYDCDEYYLVVVVVVVVDVVAAVGDDSGRLRSAAWLMLPSGLFLRCF